MATDHKERTGRAILPESKPGEINFRAVIKILITLLIAAVIIHILIWFLFRYLNVRESRSDRPLSPLAPREQQLPPAPRLQQRPQVDFNQFRANEEKMLRSYGWIDKEKGTVRIPIDRAMKEVLEKNLLNEQNKQ